MFEGFSSWCPERCTKRDSCYLLSIVAAKGSISSHRSRYLLTWFDRSYFYKTYCWGLLNASACRWVQKVLIPPVDSLWGYSSWALSQGLWWQGKTTALTSFSALVIWNGVKLWRREKPGCWSPENDSIHLGQNTTCSLQTSLPHYRVWAKWHVLQFSVDACRPPQANYQHHYYQIQFEIKWNEIKNHVSLLT